MFWNDRTQQPRLPILLPLLLLFTLPVMPRLADTGLPFVLPPFPFTVIILCWLAPADIARGKGCRYWLWLLYGILASQVALYLWLAFLWHQPWWSSGGFLLSLGPLVQAYVQKPRAYVASNPFWHVARRTLRRDNLIVHLGLGLGSLLLPPLLLFAYMDMRYIFDYRWFNVLMMLIMVSLPGLIAVSLGTLCWVAPVGIARGKRHPWPAAYWRLYSLLLGPVALLHALCLPTPKQAPEGQDP